MNLLYVNTNQIVGPLFEQSIAVYQNLFKFWLKSCFEITTASNIPIAFNFLPKGAIFTLVLIALISCAFVAPLLLIDSEGLYENKRHVALLYTNCSIRIIASVLGFAIIANYFVILIFPESVAAANQLFGIFFRWNVQGMSLIKLN